MEDFSGKMPYFIYWLSSLFIDKLESILDMFFCFVSSVIQITKTSQKDTLTIKQVLLKWGYFVGVAKYVK